MITDGSGKIFENRRKKERRQGERRTKNIKVETESRVEDRRKGDRRKK